MSTIWRFSPSSEALIRRCIDAAAPHHADNKWTREFQKFRNENFPTENSTKSDHFIKSDEKDVQMATDEEEMLETGSTIVNFFDEIESSEELENRFNSLALVCMQGSDKFRQLAQHLPTALTEKFCQLSINNTGNMLYIENFYRRFLPAYLKSDFNRSKMNFLVKAKLKHPQLFKIFLQLLVKDLEIPNKVLQGAVSVLNAAEKYEFLVITLEQISKEELTHHMFTLHSVYRDCNKSDKLQNALLTILIKYAQDFCIDKEYGRLLLTFLQVLNHLALPFDCVKIERLVEAHGTAFKEPCLMILNKMTNNE